MFRENRSDPFGLRRRAFEDEEDARAAARTRLSVAGAQMAVNGRGASATT